METTTTRSMHPLTAIAAVSVTLFSLAGIGAITGLIPTSHSQPAQIQAAKPAEEPSKLAVAAQPVETATATTTTAAPRANRIRRWTCMANLSFSREGYHTDGAG